MANNNEVNIPVNIEVQGVEQSLDNIRDGFKDILATGKKVSDIDFNNLETLDDLFEKANKEAQRMLIAFGKNSQQFKTASENAGKLKREVEAYGRTVDNLKLTGMQRFTTYATVGMTGIVALQGAMNAFGVESEDAVQAIAKLQGLMAFSQAIKEIRTVTSTMGLFTVGVVANNVSLAGTSTTIKSLTSNVKTLTGSPLNGWFETSNNLVKDYISNVENLKNSTGELIQGAPMPSDAVNDYLKRGADLAQDFADKATGATGAINNQTTATNAAASSMSNLKKAMILLGVGAFIVALGLMIAYWDDITEAITGTTDALKRQKSVQEEVNKTTGESIAKFNVLTSLLKGLTKESDLTKLSFSQQDRIVGLYNETLGAAKGKVDNVKDALAGVVAYGDVYIDKIREMARETALMAGYAKTLEESFNIQLNKPKGFLEKGEDWFRSEVDKYTFGINFYKDTYKERLKSNKEAQDWYLQELGKNNEKFQKNPLLDVMGAGISTGFKTKKSGGGSSGGGATKVAKEAKNYIDEIKRMYAEILKNREAFAFSLSKIGKSERDAEILDENRRYQESLDLLKEYHKKYLEAVTLDKDKKAIAEYKNLVLMQTEDVALNKASLDAIDKRWGETIDKFINDGRGETNPFLEQIETMNADVNAMLLNAPTEEFKTKLEEFRKYYSDHILEIKRLSQEFAMASLETDNVDAEIALSDTKSKGIGVFAKRLEQIQAEADMMLALRTESAMKERALKIEQAQGDADALEQIEQEHRTKLLDIQNQYQSKKNEIAELGFQQQMEIANASANALGALGDLAGEETAQGKALKIAEATINMFTGAVTAFTSAQSLGPVAGPIVGGLNAGAVIAMGMANIKKIQAVKIEGKGSGGGVAPVSLPSSVMNPLSANGIQDVRVLNDRDTIVKNTITDKELADSRKRSEFQNSISDF